ncbi:hypothetical protein QR680_000312 [Steinernema hermaphroditum]|uniref:Trafficking protein particle complex subunit 13 n=1 Tax=Steinernema hermaphroditum TaxID=289476 RepID=A0AA39LDY3_9BILA|nr:hypothetical protein QR680_000312 [Steinernema hermaphroditum]
MMCLNYEIPDAASSSKKSTMTESNRDQLLSLKVMRLARPKFHEKVCVPVDPLDPFSTLIETAMCKVTGEENAEFPVGKFLMAPQMFDNIYLGETFSFYVSVLNESSQKCYDVCVKADLQTTSQRVSLNCRLQDANAELEPDKFLGQVVSHEIKETGQHILVCAVNYKTQDGEKMYFRKFFKFPVTKPIDVRTKFYNAENNDVYLEAQIQNTCSVPMILEKVELDPSEFYTCSEIKPPETEDSRGSYCSAKFLSPKDVRQYLYCLTPKTGEHSLNYYRGVTSIGKLDMCWRTSMGERGRLQTSPLQRMAPGYGDLRLTVERVPATVKIHQTFQIICKIHNCSERPLDLSLHLDNNLQPAMVFCCTSGLNLGQLLPNNSLEFTLELLPTQLGLQNISGLRVTDTFLRRTYEHDEIAQVFVQ